MSPANSVDTSSGTTVKNAVRTAVQKFLIWFIWPCAILWVLFRVTFVALELILNSRMRLP